MSIQSAIAKEYPESVAFLDIEIFPKATEGSWNQARILVHGWDDVFWTDSPTAAIMFLSSQLKKMLSEV